MAHDELMYACRALALFVSAVFNVDIPAYLVGQIPVEDKPQQEFKHIDYRYIRGLVTECSDDTFTVNIDQDATEKQLTLHFKPHQTYLKTLLKKGSQVNLSSTLIQPKKLVLSCSSPTILWTSVASLDAFQTMVTTLLPTLLTPCHRLLTVKPSCLETLLAQHWTT